MTHIGILPYEHSRRGALQDIEVGQLIWPLGTPPADKRTPVAALGDDAHVIVYPNRFAYLGTPRPLRGRVSLLVAEPAALHRYHLLAAMLLAGSLYRVLTFDSPTLRRLSNATFVAPGNSWVDLSEGPPRPDKTSNLSLIASSKRRLRGHRLRHATVAAMRQRGITADILGRGYQPIPDKETGLLRLDRVLFSSVHYPANYGFIPQTYCDDHDPLDILVICSIDVTPMCVIEAKVIGAMEMALDMRRMR